MDKKICHEEQNTCMDSARFFVFLLSTVVLMGNLTAIIDFFIHPEKPYFSQDHFIVGGITSLVCGIHFYLTVLYASKAGQTFPKGGPLESILPICANCKKIRISDSNMDKMESWQALDCYITEHTATKFSHGFCPDCLKTLYPGLIKEVKKHHLQTSPELGYT